MKRAVIFIIKIKNTLPAVESPDNREAIGYGAVTAVVQMRGCGYSFLSRVVMAERRVKPQD